MSQIKDSYDQLFRPIYPDIMYVQPDRPHNYNLFLKIIALVVLLAVSPLLTMLPVYPLLYVLMSYNFNGSEAFASGVGKMNVIWVVLLYVYYISSVALNNKREDAYGSIGYISVFMGLTPILLFLSWYYAAPVSVHDTIASSYNTLMGKSPFVRGGIGYTSMRGPDTVINQIETLRGGQIGGGIGDFFGIGISGAIMVFLGSLIILTLLGLWWIPYHHEDTELNQDIKARIITHT